MKPEFSRQIFEKQHKDIKFHENPSSGRRVVTCGQMDRHEEINVAFLNSANSPRNLVIKIF